MRALRTIPNLSITYGHFLTHSVSMALTGVTPTWHRIFFAMPHDARLLGTPAIELSDCGFSAEVTPPDCSTAFVRSIGCGGLATANTD